MRAVEELRAVAAAITFQTRLPLGRRIAVGGDDVARSGVAFPLVGAGVGAAVGGVAVALAPHLSPLVAAAIALAFGALLTGGLHLDALADTADALGARTRERALEIMRDHAIGAYGATGLGLDLLLKAGVLAALDLRTRTIGVVAAAGAISRAGSVALAAALPYARAEGGTGVALTTGGRIRAFVGATLAVGIALAAAGTMGAAMAGVALAVAVVAAFAFRAWLGGVTGDTLGAVVELTETAGLVTALAILA